MKKDSLSRNLQTTLKKSKSGLTVLRQKEEEIFQKM
jgi:hypothetical protein